MEVKTKRSFPFDEDFATHNQVKKFKIHNQIPSTINSMSEYNFIKESKVQSSGTLKRISLADKMIPMNIEAYVGQKHIIGPNTILNYLLEKGEIPSMIFWGPPGCGKTSLANIIACLSRKLTSNNVYIVNLSAASSGVKSIKDAVTAAKEKSKFGCKTIVFMDEIHCFNKLQQDIFLPHVETGTFTLIGCTTENPFYSLNPALLSRCRMFMLNKLTECNVTEIVYKALDYMNGKMLDIQEKEQTNSREWIKFHSNTKLKYHVDNNIIQWLVGACDGDARVALNALELAMLARQADGSRISHNNITITLEDIKEGLIKTHMLSEKETNQSHHIYSALHKSIRAGKANASLYWLARIMAAKEDPVNIARRLVRISSEDIGLADPDALGVAVHTMHGCQMIGMPECDVLLGQCTVYLAKAPKSRSIYNALRTAEKMILECEGPQPAVPLHMRCNSNTKL
ncbi:PREDICTED: ATPase WRNIP1-like isoform X1 [Cyphomyrmex costatus]|uniref:ATPase WRNIP1 n=2 Tax=Cyphomyrmex costatus TaxID=456900 RepID=A0A195D089_9HYME|nr:PREDICTED: ATPase WRNIP1-like isoform X1 [Cyphomyrmex costatus]XP_018407035.1 PREDICTED: ATPase WRNIP1-like isoform X1 [Cyphomyrmex costatus]KYN06335.1 ATPase WRNIP1 [Cyphomyrmex costatus]